jgi:eight-cysteine-cluster-containing protein
MKIRNMLLVAIFFVLALGCMPTKDRLSVNNPVAEESPYESNEMEDNDCSVDADCVRAGCSSQLCLPKEKSKGIMTTCEFKPEYECLSLTVCGCNKGACEWEQTQEYLSCKNEKKEENNNIIS